MLSTSLLGLPRLYLEHARGILFNVSKSQGCMEVHFFLIELSDVLLSRICVDLYHVTTIFRRNLTRVALLSTSLTSFSKEEFALVRNCLHSSDYFKDSLLTDEYDSVVLMTACLNFQLLLRRMDSYLKVRGDKLYKRKLRPHTLFQS